MVACLVAIEFGVQAESLFAPKRGRTSLSFVRQIAMYLTAIVYEVSLAGVARAFKRDPSTVSHACQLVEDMRDDPALDAILNRLETVLASAKSLRAFQAQNAA